MLKTIVTLFSIFLCTSLSAETLKVGILHSLTGTMAISEKGVVDAINLAIDEINAKGGVLGKKIVASTYDGKSDWDEFAKGAAHLIDKEKVATIFGCWTSASRKKVLPVVESKNHLLWYPVQYEGMEQSPNIVYTGAAPNQQILPAVDWALGSGNLGKNIYLVGSDYVYPRTANKMVKAYVKKSKKGKIVGESYRPLGDSNFDSIAAKIAKKKPSFIINTINGDSNIAFFEALKKNKIQNIPVISMSIAEPELKAIGKKVGLSMLEGHYAAWNYFQSLKTGENDLFVNNFKSKFGADRVLSDPQEAAYFQVYLFKAAVEKAGSTDTAAIRKAVKGLSYQAPAGLVTIDPQNNHTHKRVLIGKIGNNGQFEIVHDSKSMVAPVPIPDFMK